MIFSNEDIFSDDQAITATAISENVIDLGVRGTPYDAAAALNGDFGKGTPVPFLCQVTETFATLTSLTITLETADNAALSSGAVVVYSTGAIAAATLVQGYQVPLQVMPEKITKRYLGLRYTVGGSNATAGKITAAIVAARQTNFTGA